MTVHLVTLAHSNGALWVLREGKMAFTDGSAMAGKRMKRGDRVLLYATKSCWKSYSREGGGLIFGEALVLNDVDKFRDPARIAGLRFPWGCHLFIETLSPFGSGVSLADHVNELNLIKDRKPWSVAIRKSPVTLEMEDAALLTRQFSAIARPFDEVIDSYPQENANTSGDLVSGVE